MSQLRIDDQKLFYFPTRIGHWLNARTNWSQLKHIYPVYIEVSPAGGCNHRCTFCALDFMGYKPRVLGVEVFKRFARVAARKGVKSVMFGGEGEPLLNRKLPEMIAAAKSYGFEVAITTNGVLLDKEFLDRCLSDLSWIKISLDAGTARTHAEIHGCSVRDFARIMENIATASQLKICKESLCDIGVQILLMPENRSEIVSAARRVRDRGANYFVVKPYSQGLWSNNRHSITYSDLGRIEKRINALATDSFHVAFRSNAFQTSQEEPGYCRCLAVPFFWAYVATNGDVYTCSNFLGQKGFRIGNIGRDPFNKIWEGPARRRNWNMLRNMSTEECRRNCRMDKVNRYLENLRNPPRNHTFI